MTEEQEEKIFQQWSTTNKPLPEIAEAAGVRYCEAAKYINTITTEQERMDRNDRCEAAAKPERREPWQDNETKEEAGPEQAAEPETEAEEATEEDYLEHAADRPEPEEAEQPEAKDTAAEQKIEKKRANWRAWYYRNKANKGKADKKASRRGKSAPVPLKINAITGQPSTEIENMVAEAEQYIEKAAEILIKVQAEIGKMKAQIRAEVIAEIREKLQI